MSTQGSLNAFQRSCRERLDATFAAHRVTPLYSHVPYDAGAPVRPADAPQFLHARIHSGERQLDAYVYADEAGANVDKSWFVFERGDHTDPSHLTDVFIRFVDLCLKGEPPVDAYRAARGSRATG